MKRPVALRGEQVFLSRLDPADAREMFPHYSNLELGTLASGWGRTFSLEALEKWISSENQAPNAVLFGIFLMETETLIGTVALRSIDLRHQTASLGIGLFRTDLHHRGIGTEATRLMVQYGMYHLNLFNIDLLVVSGNAPAIRAYQKVGFREIGTRTGTVVLGGKRQNDTWMEITREEVDLTPMRAMLLGGQP